MADRLHLSGKHQCVIKTLVREHLPGVEAWAYGSRINGRSHDGSDLDLVLRRPGLEKIPPEQLADFEEATRESTIPFLVEARDWAGLPDRFCREIKRNYVVLVSAKTVTGAERAERHPWTQLNLGKVCSKIGSGATPRGGKDVYLTHGPYALIRSQNVFNDGFRDEGLAYIGASHASQLKNVEIAEGDVLLNITGDSVARVCQVRPDVLPARVNQHVTIIRPDREELDPRFLRYALVSPELQAKLLSWAGSGGTRNALTKGMIESLSVAAPQRVCEQRAIAHILGTLDDKIELNRRMNETLEAMARAIFKDWFVDFGPTRDKAEGGKPYLPTELWDLFPDALGGDGKPVGWSVCRASNLFEFNPREFIRKGTKAPYLDMAALSTTGPIADTPIEREYKSGSRFRDGDTLFARITPCLENGKTAFVFDLGTDVIGWGSTEFVVIRSRQPLPRIASYLLARNPRFRAYAERSMTGTSGRQRANVHTLGDFELSVPITDLLWHTLGKLIDPMMDKVVANAHESRALAQLRDFLLPKLISGEIRTSEAAEVAETVA